MSILILGLGLIILILNLYFFKRLNPILLFSVIWIFVLFLSSLELMKLDEVKWDTYLLLLFLVFFSNIGAILGNRKYLANIEDDYFVLDKLGHIIFFVSIVAISINFYFVLRYIGGFSSFILGASQLYHDRIEGTFKPPIPYFGSLIFISCVFFGRETVIKPNMGNYFFSLVTLLYTILDTMLSFGRANFIIGFLLYLLSFFLSNFKKGSFAFKIGLRKIVISFISVLLFFLFLNLIRDTRGGTEDYYFKTGTSPFVEKLNELGIFRPSLYFYLVGPVAAFDNIFEHEFIAKNPTGYETFAPLFRPFYRLFDIDVDYYEEFINIGDKETNIGTMFKPVFLDFGIFGLYFFPLIIGFISTLIFQKWKVSEKYIYLNVFFIVYLVMGIMVNLFSSGQFFVPLVMIFVSHFASKIKCKLLF
ncbi:MAG: oligosaccharide repeat unit polymerase [Bacteroidetes bacterium]|nr:oligosaccharide repeat unit polymerase [Bacteroidota bacterium]